MLEFLLELVVEVVGEVFTQLFLTGAADGLKRRPLSPVRSCFAQGALGLIAGALSLWIWPQLFAQSDVARWGLLILTPMCVGGALWGWARFRERPDAPLAFARGFCFALGMTGVRFLFGT